MSLLGTLACLVLALPQGDAAFPPSPFDRVVELEFTADDEALIEGRGPTQVVEHEILFSGTLHVWTRSELDLFLRVEDALAMRLLGEDDDSGGGETPYLRFEVNEGDLLAVVIALPGGFTGSAALHLIAAPETEATLQAAALGSLAIGEATRAKQEGELETFSALLRATLENIEATPESEHSQAAADFLWGVGLTAQYAGEMESSLRSWGHVQAHRVRTLPPDHSELLMASNNLATALSAIGDLAGARPLWESVLKACERTLPEGHRDLSRARANLATSMQAAGDVAGARALREVVLEARERTLPEGHPDLLHARITLANSMTSMGDFAGACALREAVLEARERTLPADHPDLLNTRSSLANSMTSMGALAGARSLWEEVLEARERTLPADHPDLLSARHNLAVSMHAMGDVAGARALEEAVLQARERTLPADHPDLLSSRSTLANSMASMGDLAGAHALEKTVLEARERTLPADHPDLLLARHNLAVSMWEMGDLAGARALFEAVLEARERTLPAEHPDLLVARSSLANWMQAVGDFAGARALEEAVLKVRARTLPAGHLDLMRTRDSLANSMADMGDLAGARALLPALCAGMRSRILESLALAPRQVRQTVGSERSRLSTAYFLSETADPELQGIVFELTETMRLAACEAARSLARFNSDPELAPILAKAGAVRRELNDLIAGTGRGEADAQATSAEVARLSLERDRLEGEASRLLAERGVVTQAIETEALLSALGPKAALVGYRRMAHWTKGEASNRSEAGPDHLLANVLCGDGTLTRVDLGPAGDLALLATAWRSALGAPLGNSLFRGTGVEASGDVLEPTAGARLRERILDPILRAAGGDVARIHVCADDLVYSLPFDALPLDDDGERRLGDRISIVNEVSLARLMASIQVVPGESSLLALGGVDYSAIGEAAAGVVADGAPIEAPMAAGETRGGASRFFPELPATMEEVEGVARLFGRAFGVEPALLTGKQTTKAALFEAAGGKSFVHLATHGWFAPESVRSTEDARSDPGSFARMGLEQRVTGLAPMTLCGLAMAGANRGRDSLGRVTGILTAEELCSLDLSSCELAVLSACETNVGIRRAGQGIQSLQAALYAAGARTSITSLWKVDDAATRSLMEAFYTNLWIEGMGKAEALWEAKKALRAGGDPPANWAGWVLTGDPD